MLGVSVVSGVSVGAQVDEGMGVSWLGEGFVVVVEAGIVETGILAAGEGAAQADNARESSRIKKAVIRYVFLRIIG